MVAQARADGEPSTTWRGPLIQSGYLRKNKRLLQCNRGHSHHLNKVLSEQENAELAEGPQNEYSLLPLLPPVKKAFGCRSSALASFVAISSVASVFIVPPLGKTGAQTATATAR